MIFFDMNNTLVNPKSLKIDYLISHVIFELNRAKRDSVALISCCGEKIDRYMKLKRKMFYS